MRKSIVFIVLAIPVLIAIILKFFGQNQYEIPVYYKTGIYNESCDLSTKDQYRVAKIVADNGVLADWDNKINVIHFLNEDISGEIKILEKIERVLSTMDLGGLLEIYVVSDHQVQLQTPFDFKNLIFDEKDLEDIANCKLLVSEVLLENQTFYKISVLIDGEGRIRGYYNLRDVDEFDRLSAEIDILKMEYEAKEL